MKVKDLLKKILPVAILLVVIAIGAIIFAVVTKDKENPTLSKDNQSVQYFSYDNGKITFTNSEAYTKAKNSYGVAILTEMIDKDLLAEEVTKVAAEDVVAKYVEIIFAADSINEYLEDNEIEDADAEKKIQEAIDDFTEGAFVSYGIKVAAGDITFTKNADEYVLNVESNTAFYEYAKYLVARYNYAYAKLVSQWADEYAEYKQYLADYKAYEEYLDKLADYKASIINDEPTAVDCPTEPTMTIKEAKFEDKWNEEHVDKYWAVVIPYSTVTEAETALLQHGFVIKTVSVEVANVQKSRSYWFHYGMCNTEDIASEDKDGYGIITDSDYYKDLAQAYENDENKATNTSANPDQYGAYVLSEEEIKQAIINLYNQYYGYEITTAIDAAAEIALDTESKFYFTGSDLTGINLLTNVSGNKFNEFDAENTDFRKVYSEAVSSTYPQVYWILGKADDTQWEDATDEQKTTFMEKEDLVTELLEAVCTTTIVNNKIDELRVEKGLIIYDTDLEADYLETYTSSEYESTKKSSKNAVAKCDGKEYTADALLDTITKKYASSIALAEYQYQWMFLVAADEDNNLFNKYVDYAKFLGGADLKKCIYDNEEAEELWDSIAGDDGTINSIKSAFTSGSYESYGFGADYGWKNFLRDFFSEYYGVNVTSNDELAAYLIYQQIVQDYNQYIADVKNIDWNVIEYNFVETLDNFIDAIGFHLLICVDDPEDSTGTAKLDPSEWSQEQVDAANELYGKVLSLAKDLNKEDIVTLIQGLSNAFSSINKYPVNFANGEFITDNIVNDKGNKKFNYEYVFKTDAQSYDSDKFDLAYYKSLGLNIKYEELTTTYQAMVEEFEAGVREMWDANIDKIIEGNGTYEEVIIHDAVISTQYGYHFYVNTSFNLVSYISEEKLITLPSKNQVALYQYETNNASEDGYKSVVELLADYVEADQRNDEDAKTKAKDAIVEAMAKVSLEEKVTSENVTAFIDETLKGYTNYQALVDKSTKEGKIDADDLVNNTFVQTQITTWFNDVNTENTGSSYLQLKQLLDAQANIEKFALTNGDNTFKELVDLYVEGYQGTLTYNKGVKAICEDLLKVYAYDFQLATKFDATLTAKVKADAETIYNGLNAEDKAELKDSYDTVFGVK